ncbi:hypothetical protein I3843_01G021200 [Carya illinoinensis]|nr:hypothetical protein I3843_01G021200 [Carya illinoinensis]
MSASARKFFGNAAAGAAFQETFSVLRELLTEGTKRTIECQSYLEGLDSTLSRLEGLFENIPRSQDESGRTLNDLDELVKKGKKLVDECSNLKWWKQIIKFAYANKLQKMDKELLAFLQRNIMVRITSDLSEWKQIVKEIRDRLNTIERSIDQGKGKGSSVHEDKEDAATAVPGGSS